MAPVQSVDSDSLFHLSTISQWVSLPPASLANPLPALCAQVLSPLLLSYYPPAEGIVLAWQDVELSETPPASAVSPPSQKQKSSSSKKSRKAEAEQSSDSESGSDDEVEEQEGKPMYLKVIDEYSAPFLWCTATLLVFRPQKNAWIEGRVLSQAASHITFSYLNVFSVSVVSQQLPKDWTWCAATGGSFSMTGGRREGEREGYWMDAEGMPVGQTMKVRIKDWDAKAGEKAGKGFLRMEGSLVGADEEAAAGQTVGERRKDKGKKAKSAKSAMKATQAQTDGDAMEIE
jgi:DNA-directed RNA polymerase I subunit RPA43